MVCGQGPSWFFHGQIASCPDATYWRDSSCPVKWSWHPEWRGSWPWTQAYSSGLLHSISLIYTAPLTPAPHWFWLLQLLVRFEIGKPESSNLFFILKIVLAIHKPLQFPFLWKNSVGILIGIVLRVDQSGKDSHLSTVVFPSMVSFHLLGSYFNFFQQRVI